ncbi:amino acid ABC transporter substrate-binding protein [Pseudoalteromonas sp. JBTF-M23]|uniref:Amino acid ABC transporter substrate-binding protein n=1 Tax=Pseudoalteromonas caenipelagi TaxID=2726988 RepID=A0A849V8U6_9GAMM|nr:transporter substrate-binding domain-containing protein [Pseudoalteromonas caenipelagi]NOU49305.1 amino acid ABC transporter substrate-binding protein [Pseudoalteromonas caenipelagi]
MFKGLVLSITMCLLFTVSSQAKPIKPSSTCGQNKLLIAWHPYKPFSYFNDSEDALIGYDIQLLSSILDNMGCKYEFVQMTWKRTLVELERGHIDIGMYAYKTKSRKDLNFSKPYRNEVVNIAMLSKNGNKWSISQLSDLNAQGVVVATDKHTWYGKEFERYFERYLAAAKASQIFHIHGLKNRLDMLVAGRVDAVIGDPITMRLYMQEMHNEALYIHPYKIYDEPVHFIFSKLSGEINDDFLSRFNDELSRQLVLSKH